MHTHNEALHWLPGSIRVCSIPAPLCKVRVEYFCITESQSCSELTDTVAERSSLISKIFVPFMSKKQGRIQDFV